MTIRSTTDAVKPHYCRKCSARLFDAHLDGASAIEIKCHRCGELNAISAPIPRQRVTGMQPDGQGGFRI